MVIHALLRWSMRVSLLALTACGPSHAAAPPSAASPLLGQSAPEFRRPTLAGDTLDTKTLRGRVVVVKFFAKYCEPCKKTLPEAERLHQDHPNVAFVGIDEDEQESTAREVVAAYGLTFPVLHDRDNVLSGRFRVGEMPYTFVLDATGAVRWVGATPKAHTALGAAVEEAARAK
jgi:cytochrome c biogenesis protein CcmG/thiol:disulfide interchange protein DsbE